MFHLKYPRFRGFFAWDELGCLSRALGFPVDMFRSHVTDDIMAEEKGLPYKEVIRMLDFKHLYKAIHLTINLHTADWNTCVIRSSLAILNQRGLTFEEINNARVAYQAYEAGDMKGMLINQHTLMRTLKMCSMTISPMKLMHRLKHNRCQYDEPGRIQLYEFLDLILWAHGYEEFTPDKTYGHFEMEDSLFKLTDFDHLLSHHDQRLATRLDTQYLKDEWDFKHEKLANKSKFRDPTVVCGDSRMESAKNQKNTYKFLRSEVGRSQKTVHNTKSGCVRERPLTAPDLHTYRVREQMEYKRRQSQAAQTALYDKLQRLIKHTQPGDCNTAIPAVDLSDKPVKDTTQRALNKPVVTDEDVEETEKRWQQLMFQIETEEGRHEIAMEAEMDFYIPGYKEKREEKIKPAAFPFQHKKKQKKSPERSHRTAAQYDDVLHSLAYPTPHIPPSHAKKCDARFRGWYGARSRKGPHYILMSPYFSNCPKGQLLQKLAKMSEEEIKQIHGDFIYRYTKPSDIDQRPVTAPAVLTEVRNQYNKGNDSKMSRVSSGYGSMDDSEDQVMDPNDKAEGDSIGDEHGHETVKFETKTEDENSDYEDEEVDKSNSEQPFNSEKVILQDFDSNDSCATSVSEKLKMLSQEKSEENENTDQRRRSKSAYLNPGEKLVDPDPYSRSQSAMGTSSRMNDSSVVDIAPTPYMDHSKPKVVSVGSIGKISILESISEAKYWEDVAQKEAEERQKLERDVLVVTQEAEEDLEEKVDEVQDDEAESGYDGDGGKESAEVPVSSQHSVKDTLKKGMKGKKRQKKAEDRDVEVTGNIIEMLLQDEKIRRRKSAVTNAYKPGQFFSGIRAPRSSVSLSKSKMGSKSGKSTISAFHSLNQSNIKLMNNSDKRKKMITLELPDGCSQEQEEKGKDIPEQRRTSSSVKWTKPNRYDRLIQRMGEDVSNQLAKRLMAI